MSLLNIPFGDEADEIITDGREHRYQEHLNKLEEAYEQWADLGDRLATGRMTVDEARSLMAARDQALTAIIAEAEAASAYAPCTCRRGGEPR